MRMRKLLLAAFAALAFAPQAYSQNIGQLPGGSGSGTVTSVACPSGTITTSGTCSPLASNATSGDVITGAGTEIPQDSGTLLSSLAPKASPVLITPNLGIPSFLTLTNATGLVASTGTTATGSPSSSTYLRGDNTWAVPSGGTGCVPPGTTNSILLDNGAGACTDGVVGFSSGTAGQVVYLSATSTLGHTSPKSEYMWSVPSNVTVANGTTVVEINFPWSSGTITSVDYGTNGGTPSFSASVQIGGTPVTSCTALTVTSSTNTNVACTGAQTLASGNTVTVVISSTSGTPDQSWVKVNFTHTVN